MEAKDIIKKYIIYVQEKGERPANEFVFSKYIKISEGKFYTYFPSLDFLEQHIWVHTLENTIERLNSDKNYTNYSSREKLLALYYTYVEELNGNRSFYKRLLHFNLNDIRQTTKQFKKVKELYVSHVNEILDKGKSDGEIKSRTLIESKYADLLFLQFVFVIKYWQNDDSKSFEKTDAVIEKAVNLSFDLMNSNVLDSAFDFARFIIK